MELEMVVWSDNDNIEQVAHILHDEGYRTAEIRKESLGAYEDRCNWGWCKANMIDSFCVDLINAMGRTVDIKDVDEMPMYRYVVIIIVGDDNDDDDADADKKVNVSVGHDDDDYDADKKVNVVMNVGMTTKYGVKLDIESSIDIIGKETDCTISECIGFYRGKRESSLRVDIYEIEIDRVVAMASYFSHIFQQECVAVSVGNAVVFVNDEYTEDDFLNWCNILAK